MGRPSFDEWVANMLPSVALRGTCARRKAASIAIDEHNRIISMGYNGVPRGFPHCNDGNECLGALDAKGDTSRCLAIHAEINMILNCPNPYDIVKVYVSASPCKACALALLNLPKLIEVRYIEKYADEVGLTLLERKLIVGEV